MITTKTISISQDNLIQTLMQKAAEARQESILAHFSDLVAKDILVVKVEGNSLYRASDSNELVWKEQVTLELNVQDYISRLEKENSEMKAYIEEIKRLLSGGSA